MKRRPTLKTPVSIGDEIGYQEAVSEAVEAYIAFDKVPHATADAEKAPAYKLAEAAAGSSWNALTAMIDCYVARRISETLDKL